VPAGEPALRLALRAAAVVARAEGVATEVVTNEADPSLDQLTAEQLAVPVVLDARRRSIVVRDRARDTDVLVVPALADEPHLRAVARRVMRAAPPGASVLVCVDNALADPRRQRVADELAAQGDGGGDVVGHADLAG
jgi:hypothetical protein